MVPMTMRKDRHAAPRLGILREIFLYISQAHPFAFSLPLLTSFPLKSKLAHYKTFPEMI
jgi:hypothetical protein